MIIDSGVGMEQSEVNRINLLFSSGIADRNIKRKQKGIGIGLFISNLIAKKLSPNKDQGL